MAVTPARARILFLSDTHLGLDLPQRPRVARRRRGPEFFAALDRALAPAARGEVDLVVHGGDVFFRSRVPPGLVDRAFAPLKAVAERGVETAQAKILDTRKRMSHATVTAYRTYHKS